MPYSDRPPTVVYPDTFEGFGMRDSECREAGMRIPHAFCSDYALDPDSNGWHARSSGKWCVNRRPEGDRAHNWCFRCPAGFRIWSPEADDIDPYSDSTRPHALLA